MKGPRSLHTRSLHAEFKNLVAKFFCIVVTRNPNVIQVFDVLFTFASPKLKGVPLGNNNLVVNLVKFILGL